MMSGQVLVQYVVVYLHSMARDCGRNEVLSW